MALDSEQRVTGLSVGHMAGGWRWRWDSGAASNRDEPTFLQGGSAIVLHASTLPT